MICAKNSLQNERSGLYRPEFRDEFTSVPREDPIVNKRIILPLTAVELARKHAVIPPRTIIFPGPPGTGKTHFVRAIAAVLQWWHIEVSPSDLMIDGSDRMGTL